MKRIVLAGVLTVCIALLTSPIAEATTQVTHQKSTFSVRFTIPAGALCDFRDREIYRIVDNAVIFGDPDNPDRMIEHLTLYATHINLNTGYALSEVDYITSTFDADDATVKQVGLFWHLRDASGRLVLVQAGLLIIDANTGEILKVTPGFNPDFAAVLCPALGGSPA